MFSILADFSDLHIYKFGYAYYSRTSIKRPFWSPEAMILLVSIKNRDLWPFSTPEVRDLRTHCQIWQIRLAENYRNNFLRMLKNWDWPEASSFPGPRVYLNDISKGPGNSKKYDFFYWLMKTACVIRQKIIGFYALDFTSGFHPEGEIYNFVFFPSDCV